ncbi:AraC family transcriptional regulator [Paenibacillus glycanilyticus]|uniref:AraC family transcriptional regulator n=1 Tax=Paenibacillus glycanilyticus TaxID=126569 RepID=UPI001910F4A8|nr:helix-turn-helix domain-containing protein [Paenibacillus glycanilyticus]
MSQPQTRPSMGVLGLNGAGDQFRLERYPASEVLSPFIKHYWMVQWNLEQNDSYWQHVVPNPCANLVVEQGKTFFYGPGKEKFSYLLSGSGIVFGVKFRPGGLYPFVNRELSELTGRPIEVETVLGIQGSELEELVLAEQDQDQRMIQVVERLLTKRLPPYDEQITLVNQIIDYAAGNQGITKVEQVCEFFDINIRKLQRLFAKYVGVNPKSVIRLFRLQNAAEAMDLGQAQDLAGLSVELGYHDQAHFSKDFKAVIGRSPEQYLSNVIL